MLPGADLGAMDGLDDMIKSIANNDITSTTLRSSSNAEMPPPPSNSTSCHQHYTQETEENIAAVVHSYKAILNDLADTKINDHINQDLSRIKYPNFIEYYLQNASLSHYTIETELNRMNFEVTYDGATTSCKSTIQDIFWETKLHDVWRFANQSIYADVLKKLQMYFEGLHLNISAIASTSQLCLNLDEHLFSAEGLFDIVLESHSRKSSRLSIATIIGKIEISMKAKTLRQWLEQPTIKMVFDTDLRDAAITLLASEDSNQEVTSQLAPSRKIDAIVDAVSDTAQALPEQINSIMSDFSLEGAVGFFRKLIGAEDQREEPSRAFGNLSCVLREKNQLPVDSSLAAEHMSSAKVSSSSSSPPSVNQNNNNTGAPATDINNTTNNEDNEEEWDDWD